MVITIQDKPVINAEQARSILQYHTEKLGMFIDVDRLADYKIHSIRHLNDNMSKLREVLKDNHIEHTQDAKIRNAVIDVFEVDPNLLINKNGIVSLDKEIRKRILKDNPGNFSEELREFIEFYDAIATHSTMLTEVNKFEKLPLAYHTSFEGHRMILAKPEWSVANTGRIQASRPNLQGISEYMKDIITYPKNYMLVSADSGQIEPRIMYSTIIKDDILKRLIQIYDDAYYGQLHYILMTPEERDNARINLDLLEKKEWDPNLRKDLKVLGLAGSYGSTNLDKYNKDLALGYMNYIVNHPMRKELEERAKRDVYQNGVDTFYSSFGTPITPKMNDAKEKKYANNRQGWLNHLVRCAINNPLQTTAADLMCQSVYEAHNILETKTSKMGAIAAYIHDAGYFYVHEDDMHLADELIGCLAYQVRDWIPIHSEGRIGKYPQSHVPTI